MLNMKKISKTSCYEISETFDFFFKKYKFLVSSDDKGQWALCVGESDMIDMTFDLVMPSGRNVRAVMMV